MEEIRQQLNDITLENTKAILEKECCPGKKRYECSTHLLTPDLTSVILNNLEGSEEEKKAYTANLVAELGKHECSREYLTQRAIIAKLVPLLNSDNTHVILHTCRALANICYEKGEGVSLVMEEGGVSAVLQLIKACVLPDRVEYHSQLQAASIGFLLNLLTDNEAIHKQVWTEGEILRCCITLLRLDLKEGSATALSHNIFVILVTLTETIPVEEVFTSELCDLAVDMFRNSFDNEFIMTGLDFLEDAEVPDLMKENLAKSGLFELFINLMEKKPQVLTKEESKKYDLTGRVLANILTGDAAMEYLYQHNDGKIVQQLIAWLTRSDRELVYAGVLCIGNIARTDKHSAEAVEKKVHLHLLDILKDSSIDMKMQHAVLSTLRNLSIPKCNKQELVKAGLLQVLMPLLALDLEQSSPVIFKLVGTLRQVVDGNGQLAADLGVNDSLVAKVVTWGGTTICPWVSSECVRLLCWLVKTSKERKVMEVILRHGGYAHILSMVTTTHGLMQSEAVSALTITAAVALLLKEDAAAGSCLDSLDTVLVESELGEKLKQMVVHHVARMDAHILENLLTFLEVVVKFDMVAKHLKERDFVATFTSKMAERQDYTQFLPRIEAIETAI